MLALLLVIGLALAKLFLRGGDQAEIMFGVLIIVFGRDRIAGTLRVAGELQIFLGDVGRGPPNFHVRSVGLVHARQWILMMTTLCGCDPACACSDRFSWFAVLPTPVICGGCGCRRFFTENLSHDKYARLRRQRAPHLHYRY